VVARSLLPVRHVDRPATLCQRIFLCLVFEQRKTNAEFFANDFNYMSRFRGQPHCDCLSGSSRQVTGNRIDAGVVDEDARR
jgi:hypothetical protein